MLQEKQLNTVVEGIGEVPFSPKVNSSTVYDENGQSLNTVLQSVRNKIKECSSSIGEQREKIGGLQTIVDEAATIAKESADTISQSQEYMRQLNEAISDLPDGQAVSAEVADHELRVSDLEANSATKEEVTSKYGDYSDISEFLSITTDANDKIIEGIKKDGTKVFTGDVDAPNIRQLDTDVTQAKSQAQAASSAAQQASTAATQASTEAQQATAAAQQASTAAQAASTTAQQASTAAQQASEQTQQLSQDVVEKYGDYEDVSEYLEIVTDSEGKALEALHKDGTKEFFGRVISPNIEDAEQKIAQIEGNLEWFESMLSREWSQVTLDDENHILYGIKNDGTVYVYKFESPTLEAKVKELVTDMIGTIGSDVTLKTSNFLPNEVKHYTPNVSIPDFSSVSLTIVNISTQQQFEEVMGIVSGGATTVANTDLLINLQTDVKVSKYPSFTANRTVVINGNGHKILGWNVTYQATGVKGTNAYCAYTGNLYSSNTFVTPTGEVLRLARTKCYKAASRIIASDDIEDAQGNVIFQEGDNFPRTNLAFVNYTSEGVTYNMNANSVYHCKFQLPSELEDIEIAEEDNVYINMTSDWMSVTTKVKKVEDGWLYFDYTNREYDYNGEKLVSNFIGIDNDYHVAKLYTSFYFINYKMEDNHSVLIKTIDNVSTLIFPANYSEIGEMYKTMFNVPSGANVVINNAEMIAHRVIQALGSNSSNPSTASVVLDNCKIHGCTREATIATYGGGLYVTRCEFYDCSISAIYTAYNTKLLATHNYIHDVGDKRFNSFGIAAAGEYHVAYNKIVNYGYGAIRSGTWSLLEPTKLKDPTKWDDLNDYEDFIPNHAYSVGDCMKGTTNGAPYYLICKVAHTSANDFLTEVSPIGNNWDISHPGGLTYTGRGVIEYNEVYQTEDYFQNKAQHFVTMDAGAIYCGIFNDTVVIRHNTIYRFTGRGFNRGIYLDGGCNNVYVYSNIIASTPKSWSINAYFAQDSPYHGLPYTLDNVYRYVLNNYCENGIKMEGRTNYPTDNGQYYSDEDHETGWNGQSLEDNHCYFGHNIINKTMLTTEGVVNGIADDHKEEQYEISIPAYQGSFSTSLDITGWLNKL